MKSQKIVALIAAIAMSSAVLAKDISVKSVGEITAYAFNESNLFDIADNRQLNIVELSETEMKTTVGEWVPLGTFPSVEWGQQNKHIYGTNEYRVSIYNAQNLNQPYKSVLTTNPNSLLSQMMTGRQVGNMNISLGLPGSREVINTGRMVGFYDAGGRGFGVPTTNVTAHYSSRGVHFVPARPLPALGYNPNVGIGTSVVRGGSISNTAGGGVWGNAKIWGSNLNRPLY